MAETIRAEGHEVDLTSAAAGLAGIRSGCPFSSGQMTAAPGPRAERTRTRADHGRDEVQTWLASPCYLQPYAIANGDIAPVVRRIPPVFTPGCHLIVD